MDNFRNKIKKDECIMDFNDVYDANNNESFHSEELVSDEELEMVFGGNILPRGRRTFTRRCPCSIGRCC